MERKKKLCDGCGEWKIIWKNDKGNRYCQFCWLRKKTVTGETLKPTKQRKPIAFRSPKRAKQEGLYSRIRKVFLTDNPHCEAKLPGRCTRHSTDVHHKKGRIGKLLTDVRFFLSVCRPCHDWIEAFPKEAKELGFSVSRLED